MQDLAMIGELIRTQDNRITDSPIFIVQEKKRVYGLDPDYRDEYVWVDDEGNEADDSGSNILDDLADNHEWDNWRRVGYVDIWEFVTACFTEKGCEEYIKINGHNLKEPRIYAAGSYRNREWRTVRDFLKGLSNVEPKFHIGDHVRKIKGSQWKGHVVGHYATKLTPEGYAVESDTEIGSVQIYPASALEKVQ